MGRAPIKEKFQHKSSQFKNDRADREEVKSLEPVETKQAKDAGTYSQKMVGLKGLEKIGSTPDRKDLTFQESKASLLARPRIGTSKKGIKSKKKPNLIKGLNIFPQNSFGASTS